MRALSKVFSLLVIACEEVEVLVRGKAPTRVDLAGGTIDLWPIYNLLPYKATVNLGVDLPAQVEVKLRDDAVFTCRSVDQNLETEGSWDEVTGSDVLPLLSLALSAIWSDELPGLDIVTTAKSPAGAGLGGSSCIALTLVACLQSLKSKLTGDVRFSENQLVETAQNIESRIIRAPTGCQDYWGAARGALNVISFPPVGETCATYATNDVGPLAEQLLLVYSGKSRASAINNWEIFKRVFDGDDELTRKLETIGGLAYSCGQAVAARDWARVLELSMQEWQCRLELWPNIETPETQSITSAVMKAGATLARVCGAGGGGVMAVFAPPSTHNEVKKAAEAAGGSVLPCGVAHYGLGVTIDE